MTRIRTWMSERTEWLALICDTITPSCHVEEGWSDDVSFFSKNNKINRGIKYLHIKYEIFEKKSDRIRTRISWVWRPLQSHLCYTPMNWASWIRTSKYSSQSAVPYHLAIAQKFFLYLKYERFHKKYFSYIRFLIFKRKCAFIPVQLSLWTGDSA